MTAVVVLVFITLEFEILISVNKGVEGRSVLGSTESTSSSKPGLGRDGLLSLVILLSLSL